MSHEDPNDSPSKEFLIKLNVYSLGASVAAFVAAIILIVWKAASL
jgi:hypothetical protein